MGANVPRCDDCRVMWSTVAARSLIVAAPATVWLTVAYFRRSSPTTSLSVGVLRVGACWIGVVGGCVMAIVGFGEVFPASL
jgi:hypothetical protein